MSDTDRPQRMLTLTIDGCTFSGGDGKRLRTVEGTLRGDRGKEERVYITIDEHGWQFYNATTTLPHGEGEGRSMNEFPIEFPEGTDVIRTPGIDFSGPVRLIYRRGAYCVLKQPSGSHWAGLGAPRAAHLANWKLVRVHRGVATVLLEKEPGRRWKVCRDYFIAEADRRNRDDVAHTRPR